MNACIRKAAASLLVISLVTTATPSRAEMIATDATLNDRERIAAVLARADVREHLLAHGVDTAQVDARVAALSDADAALLAAEMEKLPAGGNGAEALPVLVIIIVLLPVFLVAGAVFLVAKAISVASR
jgi:hypothetical protein